MHSSAERTSWWRRPPPPCHCGHLEERLEEISRSIHRIDHKLSTISGRVDKIMTEQAQLNQDVAALTTVIDDVQSQSAAIGTAVTAIQAELQNDQPDLTALNALAAQAATAQSGLDEAVSGLTGLVPAAAPVVEGVSPASGTVNGGDTVTVSGSGFMGATAVELGTQQAESFEVASGTQLTFVTPATVAGTYDITVTTPAGTSATSAADQFTTS